MSGKYDDLLRLARQKREQYGVTTKALNFSKLDAIYQAEGITIDRWPLSQRIRAVYMCDENDPSVLVNERLPREPRLFCMVHELKHHFRDREVLELGQIPCGAYNENRDIEIGAEVFAAEFIFPEAEFLQLAQTLGLKHGSVRAEDVVHFKRAMEASVSYRFLTKRFELLRMAPRGKFAKVKFTSLEEELFGVPIYRQPWFQAHRARKVALKRTAS